MRQSLTIPVAVALSVLLSAPTASIWAQTTPATPQSEQDHSAHHPGGSETAAPASPPSQPLQRGGMPMMGMMGGQQGGQPGGGMMGGMPFEHVEGRLAFLKTELKITPEQEPQWNKFADAVRSVAQSMKGMQQEMMQGGQMIQADAQSASAKLDRYERMLSARLETVRTVKGAFDPLYASLTDEQKKTADELFGHMAIM